MASPRSNDKHDTRRVKDKPGHQIQRVISNTMAVMGVTRIVIMNLFETVFINLSMPVLGAIFASFLVFALVLTYIMENGPFDRGYTLRELKKMLATKRHHDPDAKLQCHADYFKRVVAEQHPDYRNKKADLFFCYVIDPITNIGLLFSLIQSVLRYFTHVAITVHLQFFILLGSSILVGLFVVGLRRPEHKKMMDDDEALKRWMLEKDADGRQLANIKLVNTKESRPKPRKLSLFKHLLFALGLIFISGGIYVAFQAFLPAHTLLSAPAPLSLAFAGFAALVVTLAWSGHWQGAWLGLRNIIVGLGTTIAVFYFGRMMVMFSSGMDEAAFFAAQHHLIVSSAFVVAVVFGFCYAVYFFNDRHAQNVLREATENIEKLEKTYVPKDGLTPVAARGLSQDISPAPTERTDELDDTTPQAAALVAVA